MKTFSLALRNLLRNRRRSLTTLLAMVVGAVTILLFGGYRRDIGYGLETSYVQRNGHLQIEHKDYFLYGSGNPGAFGVSEYPHIIDVVKHDPVLGPMVRVATPTLQLGGIAGNFAAGVSRTVLVTGMVVPDQNALRQWNDYRMTYTRPPVPLTGTAEDAVVIGSGVARVLELCGPLQVPDCSRREVAPDPGPENLPADIAALAARERSAAPTGDQTQIEVLAANVHGAPNVASLNVVKAETQGVKEIDDVYVAMHLTQAQRLLFGHERPQVTAIVLQLYQSSQLAAAKARLEQLLATTFRSQPLELKDFATLNPFYGQAIAMFNTIFGFIAVLIGAIVLFTVSNTMSTAVVERTVEIGTLRALGLRREGIRRLFVCEGLLLGAIGSALGVIVALIVAGGINYAGLTWTPPGWAKPIPLVIRLAGEPRLVLSTAVALTAVATLSAWWPARRAGRMNIVDALRHV